MSLLEVARNRTVIVEEVAGDRAFRRRIMEMGLVPGTAVRVVAVAPLGDPLTLELRASRLSIRKREAEQVRVRRERDERGRPAGPAPTAPPAAGRPGGQPQRRQDDAVQRADRQPGAGGQLPGRHRREARWARWTLAGVGRVEVLDVPGTYSLVARTGEEQLALAAMVGLAGERRPDVVVLCVDATQLVRGLYLVLQVLELGLPVVVALTMMDEAGAAAPDAGELAPAAGLSGGAGGGAQGAGPGRAAGGGGPADRRRAGQRRTGTGGPAGRWRRRSARCGRRSRPCRRTGRRATPWRCGR